MFIDPGPKINGVNDIYLHSTTDLLHSQQTRLSSRPEIYHTPVFGPRDAHVQTHGMKNTRHAKKRMNLN